MLISPGINPGQYMLSNLCSLCDPILYSRHKVDATIKTADRCFVSSFFKGLKGTYRKVISHFSTILKCKVVTKNFSEDHT